MGGLAILLVLGVLLPHLVAARDDVSGELPPTEREYILVQADVFFDNPFEGLAQRAFAIVALRVGPPCASKSSFIERSDSAPWLVRAYTVFGLPAGDVLIDCNGATRR
jgi:hypothetical protein